jgi:hypothetical protein
LITSALQFAWEPAKTVPFGSLIPYLSFVWDLGNRTVAVPDQKKNKYMAAIEDWERKSTHVLLEVQQLHGKLLHVSLVVPAGRAYLTGLESMLGVFHHRPFIPRTPPQHTADDLKWWKHLFRQPIISDSYMPFNGPLKQVCCLNTEDIRPPLLFRMPPSRKKARTGRKWLSFKYCTLV